MDHSCYKCGLPVTEGILYCPSCRAPLIRVLSPEPVRVAAIEQTVSPPPSLEHFLPANAGSGSIRWSVAFPAVLRAGLIAAGIMVFPVVGFGLGMLGAGILAVFFYRRRTTRLQPTMSQGAALGALSGLVAFLFFSLFVAIELSSQRMRGQFRQAALDAIQRAAERGADPQAQQVIEFFKTPAGFTLMLIMGAAMVAVLVVVLSSLAGLITAHLTRRKQSSPSLPDAPERTPKEHESSEHEYRPK